MRAARQTLKRNSTAFRSRATTLRSMTNTAIYLRISLDSTGEGLAIERQREDCEALAAARKWEVYKTYTDTLSAFKRSKLRPAYEAMIEDYNAGMFGAIIVYDLDRLTRQPRQLEDWIERAEDKGLLLVTANGEADLATDGGRLYARIKAAVARGEMERKSERQKRAAQQRAEAGKSPRGVRLTGYDLDDQIIEDEAAIVVDIFERFNRGQSLKGIAAALNEEAVTARGSQWTPSTIRTMLTNPRYAGRAVYQGKANGVTGSWEPIVDEDIFALVQSRLNDPTRIKNRQGTDRKHLGSSLYECGICDGPLRTNGTRYWCPVGGHVIRSQRPIDELVRGTISDRLSQPDVAGILATSPNAKVSELTSKANGLRARRETVGADYDSGVIDGERYRIARDKIDAELKGIDLELATLLSDNVVGSLMGEKNPAQAFLDAPLATQRAVVKATVIVRLYPAPRGSRTFNPETVQVLWRRNLAVDDGVQQVVTPEAVAALKSA